jgi:hypothetical protein
MADCDIIACNRHFIAIVLQNNKRAMRLEADSSQPHRKRKFQRVEKSNFCYEKLFISNKREVHE